MTRAMTTSNKPDTFLVGHARRMRGCRMRQKQQDPNEYRKRVNTQKREYRLRMRNQILSDYQRSQRLQSIHKTRIANRQRQRRYRLQRSYERKTLQQEKDRNYRRLKRHPQEPSHAIENVENQVSNVDTVIETASDYDSVESVFYTFLFEHDS
ncbi:unnamed protein product [Adineta steineri]|uniref:Uncharacterized protein n=1 Tax=Adineta steineri TaxID=433720 RepID=A0A815L7V4_9BILA|nr:unnamed protein product [Adineta steineri]CAF3928736.1 unnamed protein product [Adineta steineri]